MFRLRKSKDFISWLKIIWIMFYVSHNHPEENFEM